MLDRKRRDNNVEPVWDQSVSWDQFGWQAGGIAARRQAGRQRRGRSKRRRSKRRTHQLNHMLKVLAEWKME